MISDLSDTIDCLYDTYLYQKNHLHEYGYSFDESFWIHFATVSFIPWSEQSPNLVPVSHIINFYTQLYRDEIVTGTNGQSKTFIKCLLKSKFALAYALAKQSKKGEPIQHFALDVGRCTLPHVNNTFKQALAGFFIISSLPKSNRIDHRLSLGRLAWDINDNLYMEKQKTTNYSAFISDNMYREVQA